MTPICNQFYNQARENFWAEIVIYKVWYEVDRQVNLGVNNQVLIPRFQIRDKLQ